MIYGIIKEKSSFLLAQHTHHIQEVKITHLRIKASTDDLGPCLPQHSKPIVISLKSLMDAEIWYTNIKQELLTVNYICKNFYTYLYGCSFTENLDHKHLEMIAFKMLTAAYSHLQIMILCLQQYDATIKVLAVKYSSQIPCPGFPASGRDMKSN